MIYFVRKEREAFLWYRLFRAVPYWRIDQSTLGCTFPFLYLFGISYVYRYTFLVTIVTDRVSCLRKPWVLFFFFLIQLISFSSSCLIAILNGCGHYRNTDLLSIHTLGGGGLNTYLRKISDNFLTTACNTSFFCEISPSTYIYFLLFFYIRNAVN